VFKENNMKAIRSTRRTRIVNLFQVLNLRRSRARVFQEEHQNSSEEGTEGQSPLEAKPAKKSEEIAQGMCKSGLIPNPKAQEE
jgi:hypothetical protein